VILSLLEWGQQWWHWPMCECHQLIEQCQLAYKKTKKKAIEECGFAPTKHETQHLS
jgi:hypothetical protein